MPAITLWHRTGSPPSWAVRIMAEILGLDVIDKNLDIVNLEHKSPDYLKMNPMGTFPVIKDGDLCIAESHTIIKYLLNKYGKEEHKKLYPGDRVEQAAVDTINFFDTGVAFIQVKLVALPAIFEGTLGLSSKNIEGIENVYGIIEMYLAGKKYIASNEFTVADISLGASTFALNGFYPIDKVKFPLTAAWADRLKAMSLFQKIVLPGCDDLTGYVKLMWERNKNKK